ncbi:hypothetical protein B0H15DRAFT_1027038 [Mycena belliarum]|uniref:Uncharacterized protein n=1 Tax=Mycena belliarum TaxID=1033014 RepID=A0AAD6TUM4_9AGAR|nr:hypothetical protein B0H15DRAFT_1027038 [Mycena belliae]
MTVPPTTHSLPEPQRMRLMRSARKLSAILGATPFLVEPPPSPTQATPREPAPLECDATPTSELPASSVAENEGEHATAPDTAELTAAHTPASRQRPTLLLRINTAPPRTRARALSHTRSPWAADSPTSPTWRAPPSPRTSALAARRRKMARLARTLGERVPVELVFPARAPPRHGDGNADAASTASSEATLDAVAYGRSPPATPGDQASLRISDSGSGAAHPSRRASMLSMQLPSAPVEGLRLPHVLRRVASQPLRAGPVRVAKRSERGWSGEWNRGEDTVRRALRQLK